MSECRGKFKILKIINIEFPNGANIMNVQIYTIYVSLARALLRNFDYLKIMVFLEFWSWFKGILLYKIMFKRLQKLIILTPTELNWVKFYIKHSIVWQKWEVESKKVKNVFIWNRKLRRWSRSKISCFYGFLVSSCKCKLYFFRVLKQFL